MVPTSRLRNAALIQGCYPLNMQGFETIIDQVRRSLWPLLCVLAILYFGWHTIQGRHGLRAYIEYGAQLDKLEAEAATTHDMRQVMENRKKLLGSEAVDPDFLDELARRKLNYVTPDEKVIELPKAPAADQLR
jgi:cell division protein FtsB